MKTLTTRQIIALHNELIAETGGEPGLRDEALLESAAAAPFASFDGEELYPSLARKAARLAFGLARNHAFIDGNKRIAAHAALTFLLLNGVELSYTQHELVEIFLRLATGEINDDILASWITDHEV